MTATALLAVIASTMTKPSGEHIGTVEAPEIARELRT
jgi:hypothetical protein